MRETLCLIDMIGSGSTYVEKAGAYITRNSPKLLVFDGPGHDGLQIPKGTIEPDEGTRDALCREVIEESGLATFEAIQHLVTDVWARRVMVMSAMHLNAGRRVIKVWRNGRRTHCLCSTYPYV